MSGYTFMLIVESIAIVCWGLTGGMCAIRKGYDLFAIVVTGWLTALGGGIIRDLMLGDVPPVGVADPRLVGCAIGASLLVAIVHPEVDRYRWSMTVLDALALGLFAVSGTQKALVFGTSGMTAVFLGMITTLAGGLMRDILLNDVPVIVRDKHWYAFASFVGCVLTVFVQRAFDRELIDTNESIVCFVAIILLVTGMRLASVYFDLFLPGAMQRRERMMTGKPLLPLKTRQMFHEYRQAYLLRHNKIGQARDDDDASPSSFASVSSPPGMSSSLLQSDAVPSATAALMEENLAISISEPHSSEQLLS